MRVIAVTGGIGCGKSTVTAYFRELGVPTIDADAISRDLTAPNGEALPAIRQAFGDKVFRANGVLDRKALAQLAFSDKTALARLNALLHPLIDARMRSELNRLREAGEPVALLDVPLLYEAGMEGLADAVICVTVPERVQLERLRERDGMTEDEARARIRNQMPLSEKERRADRVLSTAGSIEETRAKADAIWQTLL